MPCKHYKEILDKAGELAKPMEGLRDAMKELLQVSMAISAALENKKIPKTIRIGNLEVPEPMREKPEIGDKYYYVNPSYEDGCCWSLWRDDRIDGVRLDKGSCHMSDTNCIAHAKALFSFTEVG